MPTINQLIKKPRRSLPRINKVKDLEASPQKRGVCLQVKTMTPKSRIRLCGRSPRCA